MNIESYSTNHLVELAQNKGANVEIVDVTNGRENLYAFMEVNNLDMMILYGPSFINPNNKRSLISEFAESDPKKLTYWLDYACLPETEESRKIRNRFSKSFEYLADRIVENEYDPEYMYYASFYLAPAIFWHRKEIKKMGIGLCIKDSPFFYQQDRGKYSSSSHEVYLLANLIEAGVKLPPIAVIEGIFN